MPLALVIDDDRELATMLAAYLRLEGFAVAVAHSDGGLVVRLDLPAEP